MLSDCILFVDGVVETVSTTPANGVAINTQPQDNLMSGTNSSGNHLNGLVDDLRIYGRGLSTIEVESIALNGTIRFTTASTPRPPEVEVVSLSPETNGTVLVTAKLTNKDENLPVISIFYGRTDGGFNSSSWEFNSTLNSGNPVPLGEVNGTISGLVAGDKYYFRAFAQSADGYDWSSGAPSVNQDLLAYWKMDEVNGSVLEDSVYPFRQASITGLNSDKNRTVGRNALGLNLDGWTQSIDLDSPEYGFPE